MAQTTTMLPRVATSSSTTPLAYPIAGMAAGDILAAVVSKTFVDNLVDDGFSIIDNLSTGAWSHINTAVEPGTHHGQVLWWYHGTASISTAYLITTNATSIDRNVIMYLMHADGSPTWSLVDNKTDSGTIPNQANHTFSIFTGSGGQGPLNNTTSGTTVAIVGDGDSGTLVLALGAPFSDSGTNSDFSNNHVNIGAGNATLAASTTLSGIITTTSFAEVYFTTGALFGFTSSASASAYTFTGPGSGLSGVASTNFTLTPNGTWSGTVTLSDLGSGGTFSTNPIIWTASSAAKTFTYTPAVTGHITLSTSSNPAITDPSPLTYVSSTSTGTISVNASNVWYNTYNNVSDNPSQSCWAEVHVITTINAGGGAIVFTGLTNNFGQTIGATMVAIPDGATSSALIHTFGANGTESDTLTLSAGAHTVTLRGGGQDVPGSTLLGSFIESFSITNADSYSIAAPGPNAAVVLSDSIGVGVGSGTPTLQGYTILLRNQYGKGLAIDAAGGRTLFEYSANYAALASQLANYSASTYVIALGTNDWNTGVWNATAFGAGYASFIAALKSAAPGKKIIAESPIIANPESTGGRSLSDYRTQIGIAAANASIQYVDRSTVLTAGNLADALHPNTAGHVILAAFESNLLAPSISLTLTAVNGSAATAGLLMPLSWSDTSTRGISGSLTIVATNGYLSTGALIGTSGTLTIVSAATSGTLTYAPLAVGTDILTVTGTNSAESFTPGTLTLAISNYTVSGLFIVRGATLDLYWSDTNPAAVYWTVDIDHGGQGYLCFNQNFTGIKANDSQSHTWTVKAIDFNGAMVGESTDFITGPATVRSDESLLLNMLLDNAKGGY